MYKFVLIILLFSKITFASNFSLDEFDIEINSNFLGKEVVLFGNKDEESSIIFIFEGEDKEAKLTTKVKEGYLWINKTRSLNNQPSFFAIFTTPKKTLNEIFLLSTLKDKHPLISNPSLRLYEIRKAMKSKNLYIEEELENLNGNLFLKKFLIPDNISPGNIKVYMYELKNDQIIKMSSKNLIIKKGGISFKLEELLKKESFIYVFILIVISLLLSLLTNLIFRRK
ncbi:TIGR02186 family protein [Alphaproteobacteria bacterium]|nr:TIGR02186 family protein [Alphaproteobacteria bacterium]